MKVKITVSNDQKMILINALDAALGRALKLQNSTDDTYLKAGLDPYLNAIRATYKAVQDGTDDFDDVSS